MIRNLTRGTQVAARTLEARSFRWRLRGMIGRRFAGFDAVLFPRCGAVHTCFMCRRLDVLFLDADGQVVGLRAGLRPWRVAAARGAVCAVELPPGRIAASATQLGDQLTVSATERV